MRWNRRELLAIVGVASGVLLSGGIACQRYRVELAGDVKDADGEPLQGCKVELLVRRTFLGTWTGYVSREAVTSAAGAFSFGVFAPFASAYRLRVMRQGYQESLLDAPLAGIPSHVHVILRRLEHSEDSAEQPTG